MRVNATQLEVFEMLRKCTYDHLAIL